MMGRRGSVFQPPAGGASSSSFSSPSPFEPSRPYALTIPTPTSSTGGISAGSAGDEPGLSSRKRSWAETVDGAGRAVDEHARSRPQPSVLTRTSAFGGGGERDEHFYGQRPASGLEGDVPPSPHSAGYVAHGAFYGQPSDGTGHSPSTLAPLSRTPYRSGSTSLTPTLHPLYSPNRAPLEASPSSGYAGNAATTAPLPSPMSHTDSRPQPFSPQPPAALAPYQQDHHPEAFAATLPTSATPGPNWAPQRQYSFDGPTTQALPYRPATSASLLPPHASNGLADFPPYSSAPSTSSRPTSYPSASFTYSSQSPVPQAASRPPQPLSFLEAPSYPLGQPPRPATTSSIPSLGLSMQVSPPGPYEPYRQAPQPVAYPSDPTAPSSSMYQSPSTVPPPPFQPPPLNFSYPSSSSAVPRAASFDAASHSLQSGKPASPPPTIFPETIPQLQQASTARAMHRSSAPILAFNPAREPASTGKQLVQSSFGVTYAVAASGHSKGKAKSAEVGAVCYTCGQHRAKVICRGSDLSGWAPRLSYSCLDCLPLDEQKREENQDARRERLADRAFEADCAAEAGPSDRSPTGSVASAATAATTSGSALLATLPGPSEHDRATFKDSFSGAVDYIEGAPGQGAAGPGGGGDSSRLQLPPEETSRGLPAHLKRQALVCDVCDRTIGAGSISSLTQGQPPAFTVEVICNGCADKYKPCSDCGGGGGRLTPGRWRCKGASLLASS